MKSEAVSVTPECFNCERELGIDIETGEKGAEYFLTCNLCKKIFCIACAQEHHCKKIAQRILDFVKGDC